MHEQVPRQLYVGDASVTDDDDAEYDIYLFWPSHSPYIIYPDDPNTSPIIPEWHALGDPGLPTLSPPLSPSYTMTSDFVFPDVSASDRGIVKAGYSGLFRSGLRTGSQRLSQRIDGFLFKLRRRLDAARQKWFS